MAKLYIEEWANIRIDNNGKEMPVPHGLVARTQLDVSGSSSRTSFAFDEKTRYIILHADIFCFVLFGDNTVAATTNGIVMPEGSFRSFGLDPDWQYLAVIQGT